MRTAFPRRVAWLAAVLLTLLVSGCLPNATWLPDSGGFVYTGGKNKDALFEYDLAKKAAHVLVEKGAGPAWPAVSPDGKRFAVALRSGGGGGGLFGTPNPEFLEVVVFDRDGKELQRSDKMPWQQGLPGADHAAASAFWAPDRDVLLLDADAASGFYDLKTKSLVPLDAGAMTFRNTPVRPDGKGFLAVRKKDDSGIVFIDWDGKSRKIEPTNPDDFQNHDNDALAGMLYFPMLHASRWDGDAAVVSWDDLRATIDTDKRTAKLEQFKPATTDDGKVIQDEVKLAGGAVVRAVELTKRYAKGEPPGGDGAPFGSCRLEVVKPGAKAPKMLMDKAAVFLINPSPDGKKAVVRCARVVDAMFRPSEAGQDMLFVIGADGDVADTIDVGK